MMRARCRVLLVPAVMVGTLLATPATSHASSPGWVVVCRLAKSLADDPIVYPGKPGASHLHDFLGNASVNAGSTYRSMRLGGTTCAVGDTSGYWVPALYKNGLKVDPRGFRRDGRPTRNTFYYRADNVSSAYKASHPVQPFPADFRMIAGNGHATNAADQPKLGKEIYWGCSDNSTGKLKSPPNCSTGTISLHVGFPNCWNGVKDPQNDTPNVVYPSSYVCPPTHPRVLPRVIFRLEYPVGATSAGITLSSGPSYTIHADFWNTWDQAKLRSLVSTCLNANKDCGTFTGSGGTTSGSIASGLSVSAETNTSAAMSTRSTTNTVLSHGSAATAASSSASSSGTATPTTSRPIPQAVAAGQPAPMTPSTNTLPFTGARPSTLIAVAIGLLCAGGVALFRTRPQRNATHR
jgi:hypothetical protein